MILTDEIVCKAYNHLNGSCETAFEYCADLDIDEDDLAIALEEKGLIRCVWCGWWDEEFDLDKSECDQICRQCKEEETDG